ncbi:oxygenase MpaB family protein [Kocuria rhizosphaericola]|uniref:oxygenase MpaB family protein n=1 Tax=Kocuria rhizosphaericola TaxID=3376284 RepID=UPI00379525C6
MAPLQDRLRTTFAGQADRVPEWELALADGEDAGHFRPGSAVWAVHGSMATIPAGVRALLTQALHPGALAGVVEHSDYRRDPLGRLAGTIRWIFTVTYGDTAAARRASDHVRRVHESVRGTYTGADGARHPYCANDPDLAEWVHLAFTDAFLRCHQRWGGDIPGGPDAYVREWAVAGRLMGVERPPRSEAELDERLRSFGPHLAGGPVVDEVVAFLRRPPLDPLLLPGYRALLAAVVDSLPEDRLELLGLDRPRLGNVPLPTRGPAGLTLAVVGRALGETGPSEAAARRRLARLGLL